MRKDNPNLNFVLSHLPTIFLPVITIIAIMIPNQRLVLPICGITVFIIQGVIYLFKPKIYITEYCLLKKWMKIAIGLTLIGYAIFLIIKTFLL